MNSREEAGAGQDFDSQRAFISEVFHNLSQPLTALQCSLEIALRRDRSLEQLRNAVQAALQDAERLRQRLILLRALNEASDPGDLSTPTNLTALLRELHEDMLLLFESAGKKLTLQVESEPILVRGNKENLSQALFTLLEYLFRYSPDGAVFSFRLGLGQDRKAELEIAAGCCLPLAISPNPAEAPAPYSCEIEMARRSFRAAGGELLAVAARPDHSRWHATLPLF